MKKNYLAIALDALYAKKEKDISCLCYPAYVENNLFF